MKHFEHYELELYIIFNTDKEYEIEKKFIFKWEVNYSPITSLSEKRIPEWTSLKKNDNQELSAENFDKVPKSPSQQKSKLLELVI